MVQTFYPGVYFQEKNFEGTNQAVSGINISKGALVACFEKGPIGVPMEVTQLNASDVFGGPINGAFGWYAMNGFFNNGGQSLFVTRVVHYDDVSDASSYTAKASSFDFKNGADSATITITAKSEGVWGNNIGIKFEDESLVNTELISAAAEDATTLSVKSVRNVIAGMTIFVGDESFVVEDVDAQTRTIKISEAVTSEIAAKTPVTSKEFNVVVFYKNTKSEVERFDGMSIDPNEDNYFENVINDEIYGSRYILANDCLCDETFPDNLPLATDSVVFLENGDDGLSGFSDTDIIGEKFAKTGLFSLDRITEVFNLFTPESCSENVKRAMYQYCEERMDAFAIGSCPEGYTVDMAIDYRQETGNFNTSYGALYYSWGWVNDPIGVGTNAQKLVPLDGHIAGMFARHDYNNSIGEVPAGEDAQLLGVNKLEHKTLDDYNNGRLNQVNVNCLRNFAGSGIVVWGARTLSTDNNWKYINARRIFLYVEKSIVVGTRWVIFKPSNISTWKSIKRSIESFLNNVPGLFGETAEDRYSVICDETVNPESIRKAGQIVCRVGLAIQSVGEFVVFEIGQMQEGTNISEG